MLTGRIIYYLIIIWMLAGCTNSMDLDTPRKIERTDKGENDFSVNVYFGTNLLDMEIVPNLFECSVLKNGPNSYIRCRIELQNKDELSGTTLNSIYFRADSLPVDGSFHSLSGNPDISSNINASKLIFNIEGQGLVTVVPNTTDSLKIKLDYSNDGKSITGRLVYTNTSGYPVPNLDIIADFTILTD